MSSIAIKLNEKLIKSARERGRVEHRSAPKQLEFWAKIGRIAEDNPDLPFEMIRDILLGKAQAEAGELDPYAFGEGE
ncbi:MAG: hypothetical protein H8E70_08995 [Candidatus Marinimicrobia bacterium]|nr:hypothetical protein [Candidatus Neomarinimicrobiota bacterium]